MVCKRCGCEFDARRYRRPDDSVQCPKCGTIYRRNPQGARPPRQNAIQPRPPVRNGSAYARRSRGASFLTKKLWKLPVWVWGVLLIVIFTAAIGGSTSKEAAIQPASAPSNVAPAQAAANAPAAVPAEESTIPLGLSADFGSSKLEVVGATIRNLGSDKYVICEYNWTNSSSDNAMFLTAITERAFQNGIALESDALLDVDSNALTEAMPGYGLTVRTVYKLSDPAAEINFSVEPFMDLTDSYSPLTFTVNPA